MRRCQQLLGTLKLTYHLIKMIPWPLAWFPENPYLDPVPYCEHLIGGIPSIDPGDYDAPSLFQLPFYYFTPGRAQSFTFKRFVISYDSQVVIYDS